MYSFKSSQHLSPDASKRPSRLHPAEVGPGAVRIKTVRGPQPQHIKSRNACTLKLNSPTRIAEPAGGCCT